MSLGKKVSAILCLILLASTTLGVYAQSKTVKIGVFAPLSGSMAVAGQRQNDGIRFAADEINAAGGVLGHKLEFIFEDDEGIPANTVNIMNKLLYRDRVVATMGSNNSPSVLAVLDIIKRAETPHIVPSGVAYAITHSGNPWVFRVTATDEVFTKKIVDYAVDSRGFGKFAIIFDTNDYGQGGKNLLQKWLKGHGLTLFVAWHLPFSIAFLCAGLGVAVVGMFIERAVFRPLRRYPVLNLIIATIGVSITLRAIALIIWGSQALLFPPVYGDKPITVGPLILMPHYIWIIAIAILVIGSLQAFFTLTLPGKAMRATAQNRDAASLTGINVFRMDSLASAISAGLGGSGAS